MQDLLSFATVIDKSNIGAKFHKNSIFDFFQFYKDYSDIACLIVGNFTTNGKLARLTYVGFIWCASHQLNLCVGKVLKCTQFWRKEFRL